MPGFADPLHNMYSRSVRACRRLFSVVASGAKGIKSVLDMGKRENSPFSVATGIKICRVGRDDDVLLNPRNYLARSTLARGYRVRSCTWP